MTAETSTPAVEQTTLSPQDRALLRMALAAARADGWRPRYPKNRRDGQWSWTNPTWPRMLPPTGGRRVVFDGRHLTVQSYEGGGCWVADVVLRVTSLSQAVNTLAAIDVLPNIAAAQALRWAAQRIDPGPRKARRPAMDAYDEAVMDANHGDAGKLQFWADEVQRRAIETRPTGSQP